MDRPRLVLGVMFAAARIRNETVSLVRFARDAAASDPGVEVERAVAPSNELATAWFERAERLNPPENIQYAVRFLKESKSEGTYALPAVVRMPATTPDEEAYEAAAREANEERDRLRTLVSHAYRLGRALARGKQ